MRKLRGRWVLAALMLVAAARPAAAADAPSGDDVAVRKLITDYGKAIESKDLDLFKLLKPNLTPDEERRMVAAFHTVKSQVVKITVLGVEVEGAEAVVRVSRRDTINGSIVSSFPQTFRLARKAAGWVIQEIGK